MASAALAWQDVAGALAQGRFEQALAAVQPQIEADPGNPRLWTMKGIALDGLGRFPEALVSFERALAISPKMLSALEGAAEAAYRVQDPRANSFLTRILKQDAGNQTAHAMAGSLAFEAGDCAQAVTHFQAARAYIDSDSAALFRLAACLMKTGQAQSSAGIFSELLARNPGDATFLYDKALAQREADQIEPAIQTLRELLEPGRGDADGLNLLGSLYRQAARPQEAIQALRRATEVAPRDERNYIDLATLCMDHQSAALALEVIDAGLHNVPASARLHVAKGAILAQLGKPDEAEREFEQANSVSSDQLYGSLGLSTLYEETRRTDDAVTLLRTRLQSTPGDYRLNYLLADTLLRAASPDPAGDAEALAALLRSTRAKPDFAKAHSALGKLYLKSGNIKAATEELRTAVRLDPLDRTGLNQLVLALRRQGFEAEAEKVASQLRSVIRTDTASEIDRNKVKLRKEPN